MIAQKSKKGVDKLVGTAIIAPMTTRFITSFDQELLDMERNEDHFKCPAIEQIVISVPRYKAQALLTRTGDDRSWTVRGRYFSSDLEYDVVLMDGTNTKFQRKRAILMALKFIVKGHLVF